MMMILLLGSLLVQVDPILIDEPGIEILSVLNNHIIGRVDEDFATDSPDIRVLSKYNPESIYLWVNMLPGSSVQEISESGEILFIDNENLLLETNDYLIRNLNSRKLMLYRLPEQTIILEREQTSFSFGGRDPIVQEIIDAVDSLSILNYVQTLQDFVSRNSFNIGCDSAVHYVKLYFENLGYDSVFYQYYSSAYAPNIYAVKNGSNDDSTYIICGHIDATSGFMFQNELVAPGADDNGSGSACVLEAARVMADFDFEHRLVFICFTGEEQGLVGSYNWCQEHQNDPIYGVINSDMIGYMDVQPPRLSIWSNTQSQWLMNFVDSCASAYVPELVTFPMVYPVGGDHSSFWDIGVSAVLHFERSVQWNPFYHTRGDTIGAGFNDLEFCWLSTKLSIAALASLAQPIGSKVEEEDIIVEKSDSRSTIFSGPLLLSKDKNCKVFDITGREVKPHLLRPGIYFIEVDEQILKKVIKVK